MTLWQSIIPITAYSLQNKTQSKLQKEMFANTKRVEEHREDEKETHHSTKRSEHDCGVKPKIVY